MRVCLTRRGGVRFPPGPLGGACSMGASCTCNAAAAGSIPVLSTMLQSIRRCPMAGRRPLTPEIEVRVLAPELPDARRSAPPYVDVARVSEARRAGSSPAGGTYARVVQWCRTALFQSAGAGSIPVASTITEGEVCEVQTPVPKTGWRNCVRVQLLLLPLRLRRLPRRLLLMIRTKCL